MREALKQKRDKPRPQKLKPSGKRRRTRKEIDTMITAMIQADLIGIGTAALHWAKGNTSDAELNQLIAELAPCEA